MTDKTNQMGDTSIYEVTISYKVRVPAGDESEAISSALEMITDKLLEPKDSDDVCITCEVVGKP